MKELTKLLMGASLVMVVSLGMVLALLLVLVAELYCSLLRKRRLRATASAATSPAATVVATNDTASVRSQQDAPTLFTSIYAQGVLQAPRSLLFPSIMSNEEAKKSEQDHEIRIKEVDNSQHCIGIGIGIGIASASSPSVFSGQPTSEGVVAEGRKSSGGDGEHLVYISNPIYDNETCRVSNSRDATPFETPDTSPSRLGMSCSSSDEENQEASASSPSSVQMTPPLTPMKKLPEQASCSISLRDARSLDTSGSGSDSVNGPSSSSSGSSRTSPSW